MYLKIPVKLESYVDEIKRHTNKIDERNTFSLLRIGVTETKNSKKLVYLVYNPFPYEFKVDANFFSLSSRIFKLYPSEFLLSPNSASAFVAYTSTTDEIKINEGRIINELRDSINNKIMSKFVYDEAYESHKNIKIEISDVDFSNTIYLDPESIQAHISENVVDYIPRYEKDIDITLESIDVLEDKVCLTIKFINKNNDCDINIDKYRLKLFDMETKIYGEVDNKFLIKKNSSKISKVYLNKIEFNQLNKESIQMKVSLL